MLWLRTLNLMLLNLQQLRLITANKSANAFESMIRLSLAAVVSIAGVLAFIPQAEASNPWKEDRKLSKQHAEKKEWKRACRFGILAGAAMAEQKSLTIDYMGKIGKRCTEAAR